jgi:hypothetical protein
MTLEFQPVLRWWDALSVNITGMEEYPQPR